MSVPCRGMQPAANPRRPSGSRRRRPARTSGQTLCSLPSSFRFLLLSLWETPGHRGGRQRDCGPPSPEGQFPGSVPAPLEGIRWAHPPFCKRSGGAWERPGAGAPGKPRLPRSRLDPLPIITAPWETRKPKNPPLPRPPRGAAQAVRQREDPGGPAAARSPALPEAMIPRFPGKGKPPPVDSVEEAFHRQLNSGAFPAGTGPPGTPCPQKTQASPPERPEGMFLSIGGQRPPPCPGSGRRCRRWGSSRHSPAGARCGRPSGRGA